MLFAELLLTAFRSLAANRLRTKLCAAARGARAAAPRQRRLVRLERA